VGPVNTTDTRSNNKPRPGWETRMGTLGNIIEPASEHRSGWKKPERDKSRRVSTHEVDLRCECI
jgi:hypothetical protein